MTTNVSTFLKTSALLAALTLALPFTAATADENPITLELKDANLLNVLSSFAGIGGLELEAESDLEGSVSMQLNQVPWETALDALCRIHTLECEIDGSVLHVTTAGDATPGLNSSQEEPTAEEEDGAARDAEARDHR